MNYVINKENCTGCGACSNRCPKKCIKMTQDEFGFIYPIKGQDCINCGVCLAICPVLNITNKTRQIDDKTKKAYAFVSNDNEVWRSSSAGGAFTEICRIVSKKYERAVFCGASWNSLSVNHRCVTSINDICLFRKSKYIESSLKDVFKEMLDFVNNDYFVVFAGTPCQVAGLKAIMPKKKQHLILYIDLICHGVGSPKVFLECISLLEKKYKKKIVGYEFRHKNKSFDRDHIILVTFDDGRTIQLSDDYYLYLFKNQICLRESCGENCIYRNENRQGDITLGDFKGLQYVFPNLANTGKNYSTIVFNTERAEFVRLGLIDSSNVLTECDLSAIKKYNPIFYRHTWFSKERSLFFDDFRLNQKNAIIKYSIKPKRYIVLLENIKRKIRAFVRYGLKK